MGDYPLNSENSENSQFNVEETQNPEQARSLQSLKVALECIERVTTSPHDSKAGFEPFRINDIKNLLSGEAYDEATKVYLSDALQFARLFEQDIENKNYALVQPRWGHYVHQTGIYYLDGHNDRILGEGYDGWENLWQNFMQYLKNQTTVMRMPSISTKRLA